MDVVPHHACAGSICAADQEQETPGTAIINRTSAADTLTGTSAADTINGFAGGDFIEGLGGNDTFEVSGTREGFASFNGGAGIDTILAGSIGTRIGVSGLNALTNIEDISGQALSGVFISGNTGIDVINLTAVTLTSISYVTGNDGSDEVYGNGGANDLRGGGGGDLLVRNGRADVLRGEAGADIFRYAALSDSGLGSGADTILDFAQADGDLINLSPLDADSAAANDQAFSFVGSAGFSGVAGKVRFQQTGTATEVLGDANGDAVADFQINLTGTIALTAADFAL